MYLVKKHEFNDGIEKITNLFVSSKEYAESYVEHTNQRIDELIEYVKDQSKLAKEKEANLSINDILKVWHSQHKGLDFITDESELKLNPHLSFEKIHYFEDINSSDEFHFVPDRHYRHSFMKFDNTKFDF